MAKFDAYAENAEALANNVSELRGRSGVRLRVGDWRVLMERNGKDPQIVAIGSRGSVGD